MSNEPQDNPSSYEKALFDFMADFQSKKINDKPNMSQAIAKLSEAAQFLKQARLAGEM